MNLHEKAQRITTVVLDIDGVLTDGRVGYESVEEIKFFNVRDGHGIKLAQRAGLRVGALSGRCAPCNQRRADELKFDFLYEGIKDKNDGFDRLLDFLGIDAEECLYIGDDVVDAPPMKRCGIAVAVADAVPELDLVADFRTKLGGGRGAVREVLDWLLKEKGLWDSVISHYFA